MFASPPLSACRLARPRIRWHGGLFCALRVLRVLCALCLFCVGGLLWGGLWCAAVEAATGTDALPYGGRISREAVLPIVRASAYMLALDKAVDEMKKHRVAQFGATSTEKRQALASAVHRPAVSMDPVVAIPPPAGVLRAEVRLATPERTLDKGLRETLLLRDLLDMRLLLLAQMRESAREGRTLALQAAERRGTLGSEGDLLFEERVAYLGKRLEALWLLDGVLTRLRTVWSEPLAVVRLVQAAVELDPRNPLLWAVLGEVQLQLDQPQNALESLNTALREAPDMSRALYARGLGHLRLQQPALAEVDLSAALRGNPDNAGWLRARGAVRMVREDIAGMCEDFERACALGDCEGLAASRKRGHCLPVPAREAGGASFLPEAEASSSAGVNAEPRP